MFALTHFDKNKGLISFSKIAGEYYLLAGGAARRSTQAQVAMHMKPAEFGSLML